MKRYFWVIIAVIVIALMGLYYFSNITMEKFTQMHQANQPLNVKTSKEIVGLRALDFLFMRFPWFYVKFRPGSQLQLLGFSAVRNTVSLAVHF